MRLRGFGAWWEAIAQLGALPVLAITGTPALNRSKDVGNLVGLFMSDRTWTTLDDAGQSVPESLNGFALDSDDTYVQLFRR